MHEQPKQENRLYTAAEIEALAQSYYLHHKEGHIPAMGWSAASTKLSNFQPGETPRRVSEVLNPSWHFALCCLLCRLASHDAHEKELMR